MKYLISSNLAELQIIEQKIHKWMKNNIKNYNAVKWADIYKHPIKISMLCQLKTQILENHLTYFQLQIKQKRLIHWMYLGMMFKLVQIH